MDQHDGARMQDQTSSSDDFRHVARQSSHRVSYPHPPPTAPDLSPFDSQAVGTPLLTSQNLTPSLSSQVHSSNQFLTPSSVVKERIGPLQLTGDPANPESIHSPPTLHENAQSSISSITSPLSPSVRQENHVTSGLVRSCPAFPPDSDCQQSKANAADKY